MQLETNNSIWLDSSQEVSIAELVAVSGISETDLREFVEIGVLSPCEWRAPEWRFSADMVEPIQRAGRLRDELDLDQNALVLVLALLGQIHALELDVRQLRAQAPQFRHGST